MAQVYKKLNIDVNKKSMDIITAVQNDAQSRFLDIVLLDGSIPIHLAEHEVRIYGKKHDGTEFYNNGEITDATAGRCQFELTSQALAVANDLEVQIIVFKDNREVLSTQPFSIRVVKSLMSDSAIESSNEYGALVVLYQNLYEAYDLMTEMVQKIGVPKEQAIALGLGTMFEVWDWMVSYLQTQSTAGIVETINTILSRIGTSNSTSNSTVMGKLNTMSPIKSIQRGVAFFPKEPADPVPIKIEIAPINPDRAFIILNGCASKGHGSTAAEGFPYVVSVSANSFYVGMSGDYYALGAKFSWDWQVVEFY